jgi:lipoate-protein ligase A
MNENNVYLVRRSSGGGAVYQDQGNSIFTFITPKIFNNQTTININNQILINALSSIGIKNIETSGRNDLHYDQKKISGAAFQHSKLSSLHHGTLLLDVDMTALGRYLTPSKAKLQSKGVVSVESRVLNLKQVMPSISHDLVNQALIESFTTHYQQPTYNNIIDLDESIIQREPLAKQKMDELQDWDWRFGTEPRFTHRLETRMAWGTLDVNLVVDKSIITEVTIHTDALDVLLIESIRASLVSCVYSKGGVSGRLSEVGKGLQPQS